MGARKGISLLAKNLDSNMVEIIIQQGDVTKVETDAIVNAANTSLLGGGGVDGAIHRAGGPEILDACRAIRNKQGGCKVGEAVITIAGKLKARFVIHTVGPKWNHGLSNEAAKLRACYLHSLDLAEEKELSSIAFPNISTGIYGYPKDQAAAIAIEAINSASLQHIGQVIFVCFDKENYEIYKRISGSDHR